MKRDWQARGNRVSSGYIQRLCKPGEEIWNVLRAVNAFKDSFGDGEENELARSRIGDGRLVRKLLI